MCCLVPLISVPVLAQNKPAGGPPQLPPPIEFRLGASHTFDGDLSDTDASVNRTALLGDLSYRLPSFNDKMVVTLSLSAGQLWYDFSGATSLAPGTAKPWSDITLASVSVSTLYFFNEKWTGFGAVSVNYAGESGADFGESLTGGVLVGASYKFSDDLSIGALLLVKTQLEDDVLVFPIPTFKWKLPFDDDRRFTLSLGGSEAGSILGAGASLSYAASDTLTVALALTGFGVGGDFRLDEDGPIPGGVGRDFSVPLVASVKWNPRPNLTLGAFAGMTLFGNVEALNSNGDDIIDRDVDPAVIIGANLSFSF